jgi:hypothetical protein
MPATRRSHANAISSPPPRAGPSIAAMVGMGNVSSLPSPERRLARNWCTCIWVIERRSTRSAPAQKEPMVEERRMRTRMLSQSNEYTKEQVEWLLPFVVMGMLQAFCKLLKKHEFSGSGNLRQCSMFPYMEKANRDCILACGSVQIQARDARMRLNRLKESVPSSCRQGPLQKMGRTATTRRTLQYE